MFATTYGPIVGVPPAVGGRLMTAKVLPPNSPPTTAMWECGATTIVAAPDSEPKRFANSGIVKKLKPGVVPEAVVVLDVHEPAVALNDAWFRSTRKISLVNSSLERAIPVVQSSAAESNPPPVDAELGPPVLSKLNTPPVAVL